jgi:hypothetical protein
MSKKQPATRPVSDGDREAVRRALEKTGHFSAQQVQQFTAAIVAEMTPTPDEPDDNGGD